MNLLSDPSLHLRASLCQAAKAKLRGLEIKTPHRVHEERERRLASAEADEPRNHRINHDGVLRGAGTKDRGSGVEPADLCVEIDKRGANDGVRSVPGDDDAGVQLRAGARRAQLRARGDGAREREGFGSGGDGEGVELRSEDGDGASVGHFVEQVEGAAEAVGLGVEEGGAELMEERVLGRGGADCGGDAGNGAHASRAELKVVVHHPPPNSRALSIL